MDTPNHAAVAAKSTIDGLRPCINFQTTPAKHIKPRQPIAAPYGSRAAAWRPRIVLWIPAFCFFAFSCFSTSVALAGNMAGKARNSPPMTGPKCCARKPARAVIAPPNRNLTAYSYHLVLLSAEKLTEHSSDYLRHTHQPKNATTNQTASAPTEEATACQ